MKVNYTLHEQKCIRLADAADFFRLSLCAILSTQTQWKISENEGSL